MGPLGLGRVRTRQWNNGHARGHLAGLVQQDDVREGSDTATWALVRCDYRGRQWLNE